MSSAPPSEARKLVPCKFFTQGLCVKGELCEFSHETSTSVPVCPFFLQGRCRYGEACLLRHPEPAEITRAGSEIECGICLEKVLSTKCRRFGLMACQHPFCVDCIRDWRSRGEGSVRNCPMCRQRTDFVTPSSVWPSNEAEKVRIMAKYVGHLSQIPCKHWNYGKGSCPHGTSCFYQHLYRDGTKPTDEAVQASSRIAHLARKMNNTRVVNDFGWVLPEERNEDYFDELFHRLVGALGWGVGYLDDILGPLD